MTEGRAKKSSWANPGRKLPGMQLTERDTEILQFINSFGFCEIPQIESRFEVTKRRSYQILERLITAGLVKHERVLHGKHGIYRLTAKGASYTDLPASSRITMNTYNL